MSGGVSGREGGGPSELLVTGHADGSVRFWDATGTAMQQLHRLRTQKLFEKNKAGGAEVLDEDPYAITHISLGADCRTLAIAGQTAQILLYRWRGRRGIC